MGRIRRVASWLLLGIALALVGVRGHSVRQQEESQSPRDIALAVLSSVLEDVREIREADQRLELTVRIAELLGREDPDRAKGLLARAFEETLTYQDDVKTDELQLSKVNALQRRIISLIAQHDEALAKSWLDRLDERIESADGASRYVSFARGLVEDHPELAGHMARKRLKSFLNWEGLRFLSDLRRKEKSQADSLFLDLAAWVASQGARDVNELLVLYAYAFSPPFPIELTRSGPRALALPGYQPGAIDPQLAVKFLQTVIPPLLAPERYAGDGPSWGPHGDFVFITVILPQCHQFFPSLTDELEMQRNALAARISERERSSWENSVHQALSPPGPQHDSVDALLERAERATSQKARDRFLFLALHAAIRKGDLEQAAKIAERFAPERREEILPFVNYLVADRALKSGDLAGALEAARRPMRPSLRAYLFAAVAYHRFRAGDHEEAVRLLVEAQQIARKLEPDRVKASLLLGISAVYGLMNESDAFSVLREAVEAINRARDFQGEIAIGNVMTVGDLSFAYEVEDEVFHFDRTFSLLGARDFHGTMVLARSLTSPGLRARAAIATCEGVLKR